VRGGCSLGGQSHRGCRPAPVVLMVPARGQREGLKANVSVVVVGGDVWRRGKLSLSCQVIASLQLLRHGPAAEVWHTCDPKPSGGVQTVDEPTTGSSIVIDSLWGPRNL